MKHRNLKFTVLSLLAFSLILSFQNCSPQFQVADTLESINQAAGSSTLPPQISFAADVPDFFNSNQIDVSFQVSTVGSSALQSVTCQLNQEPETSCENLAVSYPNLADGDYSLTIRAETTNSARAEITRIFRVDTGLPEISVSTMPAAITNQTSAQFMFTATDSLSGVDVLRCSLNNAVFVDCTSPVNLASLAVGSHNFRIQARDLAGNLSEIYSYNWTVSMAVSVPAFTATPAPLTNSTSASFSFSGNGVVSYQCQLDNGVYANCTSPVNLSDLLAGAHTFRVRGLDGNGQMSEPVQFMWVIDTTAPTLPTLMSSVGAISNLRTATMTFASTDAVGVASYQCSLDNAAFANCTSPVSLVNLVDGAHSFRVRALDGAGNISPVATFNWSVEGVDPDAENLAAGLILYANNCASCHGQVADSNKRNRSALAIQASIDSVPVMMGIELTPLQIEQIARALSDD